MTSAMSTQRSYQLSYAPTGDGDSSKPPAEPKPGGGPPPSRRDAGLDPRRGRRTSGGAGGGAGGQLGGVDVVGGDVDAHGALALVADQVERLGPPDRPGDGLAVPAALAGDDG